ncbi:uncharacterized protein PG998_008440 [Apiospora kogelbergensis]|uniref:uncharacterized protein n=1 Tax=Apiospora kogelbergensis TaxID=1337665 RepID=UPI003131852E
MLDQAITHLTSMEQDWDPTHLVEDFIHQTQLLASNSAFQYLKDILEENNSLRDRNSILSITNDENVKSLARIQQLLADETQRCGERDASLAELEKRAAEFDEKIRLLKEESESTQAKLAGKDDEVSALQDKLAGADIEREAHQLQLAAKDGELTTARDELSNKDADLEATKMQLAENEAHINNLIEEAQTKSGKIDNIISQLNEAIDDNSASKQELEDKASELDTLQADLGKAQSEIVAARENQEQTLKELKEVRDEAAFFRTKFENLDKLSFNMKTPPTVTTQQQLNSMFTAAYTWASELFAADLDPAAFSGASSGEKWAPLRTHPRVSRLIPLPISNSAEAKRMRVAALVGVLGWTCAQHMFQPTYLLQCNELCGVLASLADDDHDRETYLRSVLLPVSPSRQKENGKKRIQQAVFDVLACVAPLLPKARQEEVKSSLEAVCKHICGQWMRLQLLEEKIEPSFDAYDGDDWKIIELPAFDGSTDATSSHQQDNEARGGGGSSSGESTGTCAVAEGITDIDDIAAVLWPSFLSSRDGESELLTEGFVVAKAQTQQAHHEEKAGLLLGFHRAARQIARKDRTKSFATTPGVGEEAPKDFLRPGSGDGAHESGEEGEGDEG